MADWKVPLADVHVSEKEIAAIADTYRSGWLSMGPATERFEAAFASYVGAEHAFATANGTASLHLLLAASGIGPGDEVIVPSMTFVATVNAVAYTGATPVFCDIGALTRPWIASRLVEPLIGSRTKAIMTMPYGGHPGDTAELAELAGAHGVPLLIDAAHAIGSRIGSRAVGAFGRGAAYSFFSNKNLAIGEGGMVTTDDHELAERIRLLRSHGMTTLTWDRHRGHASSYDVVALGYNYRIDEPRATLGRLRLADLDRQNARRGELAALYRRALDEAGEIRPVAGPAPDTTSANHLFTIVVASSDVRDRLRAELADAGIQTSVHYPAAHRFTIYSEPGFELPLTEAYADRTVTLPLFAHMSEDQIEAVASGVERVLARSLEPRMLSSSRR